MHLSAICQPKLLTAVCISCCINSKIVRTMKIAFILLLGACLQVCAKGYPQQLTITKEKAPLEKVLKEIKSQTGYLFFYDLDVLKKAHPVTIRVKNASLEETLKICFRGQPLDYAIVNKIIIINPKKEKEVLVEKERPLAEIKGRVVDKSGNPLPGVSVMISGAQTGVTTDSDGRFVLTVPDNKEVALEISSVGFQTITLNANSLSPLNIVMEESLNKLENVVVVGYTTKQLSNLSSSVSVVSEEKLKTITSNDVAKLLQGKAPGVVVSNASGDPTVSSNIVIRGSGSITANSTPLYVVDGIIGGTANPSDIESVTVLKDAAATGLYGSRASNGVIIITTKSGKSGKTKIEVNSTTGMSRVTTGNFKLMDARQLYDYHKSFYPANQFALFRPESLLDNNTDWQKLAFRTGLIQNYTVSVSGGGEKTQFYIAGNYYNEEGTLNLNGIKKYNVRTNLTHKINSKLKLSVRLDLSEQDAENEASGGYGALYGAYTNIPWDPAYNADGSITSGNEAGWIGRERDNFLYGQQFNYDRSRRSNINGDINLEYKIIPGLILSTYNRASFANGKSDLYYDVRSRPGTGLGLLYNGVSYNRRLITSNRLQYDKDFGRHSLSAIAVAEAEKNYSDQNNLMGSSIPAGLHVMEAAALIQRPRANPGSISENAFSKGLVQADYNFDNRYFAVASFINESSSRFGADNRAANFYTLAGSWIISNETFMLSRHAIDLLKIRASYGITGNANIQDYQSLGLYSYSYQYAGNNAAVPFQLANNHLTWEKAKTLNLGFDIGLFKRLTLNLDWYDKTTQALLLNVQQPYTSGYSSVLQNIGAVRNRGVEINVQVKTIDAKDLKWETGVNIAFNKNKVLTLYDGKDLVSGSQRISVGRDMYSWHLRKWAGVDPQNGDPLWEIVTIDGSGNENITTTNNFNQATLQFVGIASPDFTGGISNTIAYKNFTLAAYANFVYGNTVLNSQRSAFDNDGASPEYNSMVLYKGWSRWSKPGDIATHPLPVVGGNKNAQQSSSRYLENGSYIRLQNITLGYDLPDALLKKIKIDHVKLYLSGDNLWTGANFSGMDPETPLSPGAGSIGVSNIKYPISKKILFGINVGF